jgi:peptidyl-prolyl cis-trans isomerase C
MKFLATTFLFSAFLCAQAPPQAAPQPPTPPGTPAPKAPIQPPAPEAAPPPAPVTPDTVVAEIDGKKVTAKEADEIFATLPAQYQQSARLQPDRALKQIFMFRFMAEEAEKANLDKQSPWKDTIEYQRLTVLYQAEVNHVKNTATISPEDQEKEYKDNPDRFKQAKVKVIHLTFSATPDKPGPDGKKMMSEAEAKTKLEDLKKEAGGGADFGKLARENSDDKASAAKDGDFGTISHNSPYPEAVKTAIFALKPGEVSEPLKIANGFYLVRVESVIVPPLNDVRAQLIEEMKQARFNEWMKNLETRFTVKVDNATYFTPKRPPQLQTVR